MLNLVTWAWLLWQIRPQSEALFLHYNILFGVDSIGDWFEILYLPLSGAFILSSNAAAGWLLFSRDKYLAHFLNATAVICQVCLLMAALLLVALNV